MPAHLLTLAVNDPFLPLLHVPHLAMYIMYHFRFTKRYIDDLLAFTNPLLQILTYRDQLLGPFCGLYPRTLHLDITGTGCTLPFMDLCIMLDPIRQNPNYLVLTTKLYDKREHGALANIDIVRFPSMATSLSARCIHNVCRAQVIRFCRLIRHYPAFVYRVAHLLHLLILKGCSQSILFRVVDRTLRTYHPFPFPTMSIPFISYDITFTLWHLQFPHPGACPPSCYCKAM